MNKVIDKGFRSCRFVSTIVKHPVYVIYTSHKRHILQQLPICSMMSDQYERVVFT